MGRRAEVVGHSSYTSSPTRASTLGRSSCFQAVSVPISLRHFLPTSTSLTSWLEKGTRSNVAEEPSVVSGGCCSIHTGFGRRWKEITLPL